MSTNHEEQHTGRHPTFKQYVLVAIILFAITMVEFLLIWGRVGISDDLGASKVPLLVGLSAIKFGIVIMFYMHLKFDARLLSGVFLGGLALAFLVGIALLGLFFAYDGTPREFAEANAQPYVEHEEEAGESSEPATPAPGTAVPPTVAPATAIPSATDTPAQTAPSVGDPAAGQTVFTNSGCVACHTIEGVPRAVGKIGPELTHVATNAVTRKGLSAEEYIRESIENPGAFVVDGFAPLMPNLLGSMTDQEFENLVAFLLAQN